MSDAASTTRQTFLVPEIVQTSAMDCGPAALKALVEGFGGRVSYGRLREACHTDVDGTSIDTLEDVATQLGLDAVQVITPLDHLLMPEAESLPALVITRLPNGLTHFVVVWRLHGPIVQVMDPATGRRWLSKRQFLAEVYQHEMPFLAEAWREWAGTDSFCDPLRQRLSQLGLEPPVVDRLLTEAQADPTWYGLATLDAATRMVSAVVQSNGLFKGSEAEIVLGQLVHRVQHGQIDLIPASYWTVQPQTAAEAASPQQAETLHLRGAVLIQVAGRQSPTQVDDAAADPISPEVAAALDEAPKRVGLEIWQFLQQDGLLTPTILLAAAALASLGFTIEILLLRGLIDVWYNLGLLEHQLLFMTALFALAGLLFAIEFPLRRLTLQLGRRFEMHLRLALLEKIPRLSDQYFYSRLTSDMARRANELRYLRLVPILGFNFLRVSFQLLLTIVGILLLDPFSTLFAYLSVGLTFAIIIITHPILSELDLRSQTHLSGLSRFYLDALLGLLPVRTHKAERALQREHENLLVSWMQSTILFYQVQNITQGVSLLVNTTAAIGIVFLYISNGGEAGGVILLLYWSLNLPLLAQTLGGLAQQYPRQRNRLLRLLEPLSAPETAATPTQTSAEPAATESPSAEETTTGVAITMQNVSVQVSGQPILEAVNLTLRPGEQVAIVGHSGAGKSTLAGLLLGWHRVATGQLLVDGQPLTEPRLPHLRSQTVWVDPAVQLWNRPLQANLQYGGSETLSPDTVLHQADLFGILKRLPQGLATPLGEGGGLVSGGEGQRVRLGRGLMRPQARLVILDEPFRGLDRSQRRVLLARARNYWPQATLLCITHDVGETRAFDRVLVISEGRIVEDAAPHDLLNQADSHYHTLLSGEQAVRNELWTSTAWRYLWLEQGQLSEK